ncbi:hypothetical protein [Streptomyces sp. S584]|uniref:hypothetical protein n=1 Tax=Streptomyces sp. S584 TaxID=3096010 RepID=UPI002AFEDAE0|nr:hypothetical protein [Streptomyces sp. S584]
MKACLRNCGGCGRTISGYTGARCVFGCGAYYCRRGRAACAAAHAKACPALQEQEDTQ